MEIPKYVKEIIKKIEAASSEVFIVGGCVRDLLLDKTPKDWDVTTNARPEQILKIFPEGKYENAFGTVLVPVKNKQGETEDVVEVTTYRSEHGYNDRRHPDEVVFEEKLENDLSRRDFTINAIAMDSSGNITDLFGGQKDLKKRIIRAVGEPADRFKEDALRMMRAIRFSAQLGFAIEPKTERAIVKLAGGIKFIANERIRDELIKILDSSCAYDGIMNLHNTKLLQYILPELERGAEQKQARHHIYNVFEHSVLSLKYCPNQDWRVRFAALLHDIAKPQTARIIKGITTFYNHEYLGAKMAFKIMTRLHFSNKDIEKISNLIRNHMFYYNVGEVTAASVRRLIVKVGKENLQDLIDLRVADRLGSGVAKAKPYKLRHLEYMLKKVQNDPVSVKMLKLDGDIMIKDLGFKPGPKMGAVLDVLLAEVIENPGLNNLEHLSKRAQELEKEDLEKLRAQAKSLIEEKREEDDQKIKKEFYVA